MVVAYFYCCAGCSFVLVVTPPTYRENTLLTYVVQFMGVYDIADKLLVMFKHVEMCNVIG